MRLQKFRVVLLDSAREGQEIKEASKQAASATAAEEDTSTKLESSNDKIALLQKMLDNLNAQLTSLQEARDSERKEAGVKLDAEQKELTHLEATEAKDNSAAEELRQELEYERAQVKSAALRAEAYAASAAGNATMVSDNDKAAQDREDELYRRLTELQEKRTRAADQVKAVEEKLAKTREEVAAMEASSRASGSAADSLRDSLKENMAQLQAQLDQLQQQKELAVLQAAAHLEAESKLRQQLRALSGGQDVTIMGCECAEGAAACRIDKANPLANGKPFCIVKGDSCGTELANGQRFDLCAIPTQRDCTCTPTWVTKGKKQEGCSEVGAPGTPWCHVRENGCGAMNGLCVFPCFLVSCFTCLVLEISMLTAGLRLVFLLLASGDGSWWDYCVAKARDKSAVQILEGELAFEHNRSVAEGLRAEAYAAAARGNATMVSDHDQAAQQREEYLNRRMAELEAARIKASAEIDAVQEKLAQARAGVCL